MRHFLQTFLVVSALGAGYFIGFAAKEKQPSSHILAQQNQHGSHTPTVTGSLPTNLSTQAFVEAAQKMHKDMTIAYTGQADVDFVKGMIPHHQGAIDMARIVLEHGTDETIRKLAQDVIAAQTGEIAMMEDWLKTKAPALTTSPK